jgi:hypothetical protein
VKTLFLGLFLMHLRENSGKPGVNHLLIPVAAKNPCKTGVSKAICQRRRRRAEALFNSEIAQ